MLGQWVVGFQSLIMRLLAERHRVATIPRSDAPRRNAVLDAPRRPSGQTQCRGRRASRNAFPRGAWERVQTLLLQCVMSGGRWCSPRSVLHYESIIALLPKVSGSRRIKQTATWRRKDRTGSGGRRIASQPILPRGTAIGISAPTGAEED